MPNISMPRITPPTLEIAMMRLLKRVSGRMGSEVFCSWRRKRTISTMKATNKLILCTESQDQLTPPCSRAKRRATIAPVKVSVPM